MQSLSVAIFFRGGIIGVLRWPFSFFRLKAMTEATKTTLFAGIAFLALAIAFFAHQDIPEYKPNEMVGKALFAKFTDPLSVKKLEITKPDPNGDLDEFRIVEVNGVWSIPSHDNYPADAKEQMGKSAEALVDLKVLSVIEQTTGDGDVNSFYAMYGVIDPADNPTSRIDGIGMKVTLTGDNDNTLVDILIGNEVDSKETAAGSHDESGKLRYVRVAGQTPVYVVDIDPKRFPTSFDLWIEKNLLDIKTMDLAEVYVDEYAFQVEMVPSGGGLALSIVPKYFNGDFTLKYNSSGVGAEKWTLTSFMGFTGPEQGYEYFEDKPKPDEELNPEVLDAMVFALNDLKIVSVAKKPVPLADALRAGKSFEDIQPDASLQRSGFYLVSFPDLRGKTGKSQIKLLSNEGDMQLRMKDGIVYQLRFGDRTGTESEISVDNTENADANAAPTMGSNRYLFITALFDELAIAKPERQEVPEIPAEDADEIENLKAERERVERLNKREEERYQSELTQGKQRAAKLTERFANWYYVIPEDVYKKVRIGRGNLFRPKQTASEPAIDLDGFDIPGLERKPEVTLPSLPEPSETLENPPT